MKSKYKSIKTVVDGITFDSKKEAKRYSELKLLQRAGVITALCMQVPYELIPKHTIDGIKIRATKYIADFTYIEHRPVGKDIVNVFVVEDCKGFRTQSYKNKKRQMKEKYGIEIRES